MFVTVWGCDTGESWEVKCNRSYIERGDLVQWRPVSLQWLGCRCPKSSCPLASPSYHWWSDLDCYHGPPARPWQLQETLGLGHTWERRGGSGQREETQLHVQRKEGRGVTCTIDNIAGEHLCMYIDIWPHGTYLWHVDVIIMSIRIRPHQFWLCSDAIQFGHLQRRALLLDRDSCRRRWALTASRHLFAEHHEHVERVGLKQATLRHHDVINKQLDAEQTNLIILLSTSP